VALSVTEAEYIAAWTRQILPELGQQNITPTMRLDSENDPDVSISSTNEAYKTPLSLCERRGAERVSKDF
jgi:hypothetical protein